MPPRESTLYTPILDLNLCFNKAPEASREKLARLRIAGTLPAACPSDMGKRGPPGIGCQGGALREL